MKPFLNYKPQQNLSKCQHCSHFVNKICMQAVDKVVGIHFHKNLNNHCVDYTQKPFHFLVYSKQRADQLSIKHVYDILKEWTRSDCWYGYEILSKRLSSRVKVLYSISTLKAILRKLRAKNYVILKNNTKYHDKKTIGFGNYVNLLEPFDLGVFDE